MSQLSEKEFQNVLEGCRSIFTKKTKDYGTSWRIFRLPSLTDQIFIKAQRIRSIQEKKEQKISDDIRDDFKGIINYCLIALIQISLSNQKEVPLELDPETTLKFYDEEASKVFTLFKNKNHDYGEAWRSMRVSSMTDLILAKLARVKQIEDNDGATISSEGIDSNYMDIMNYAVFCLILMK